MIPFDLSQGYAILLSRTHPTAHLAACELQTFLQRIGGRAIPVLSSIPSSCPILDLQFDDEGEEGFTWSCTDQGVMFHGNNPRSLLYAVYSFLETLGCCWFAPGEDGETLPDGTKFLLPEGYISEKPALPGSLREFLVWLCQPEWAPLTQHREPPERS